MKKLARVLSIFLVILLTTLALLVVGLEWIVEARFEKRINQNPDRNYDIGFRSLDLDTFFKGLTLEDLTIEPIKQDSGTVIRGSVRYATINGIVWTQFIFGKKLAIDEIAFEKPIFEVTLSQDETRKTSGKGMQAMFGDILSRVELDNFQILQGSVVFKEPSKGKVKGEVKRFDILASGISTDSMQWQHLIPFQLKAFTASIDTMTMALNDYTQFSLGNLSYGTDESNLTLEDLSLSYSMDWKKVSNNLGVQLSLSEIAVDQVEFINLETTSNLYAHMDLSTEKVVITGLDFKNYRDKNVPRPKDVKKPLFEGMLESIPFPLRVDTIEIKDSSVSYTELGEGKANPGSVYFKNINGMVSGVTSLSDVKERYGRVQAKLTTRFNGAADMRVELLVPYGKEEYFLRASLTDMVMKDLNVTTKPMANIEISSGHLQKLEYEIEARDLVANNSLKMDYTDLKMNILKKEKNKKQKKRGLVSSIANAAIRTNNNPKKGKYLTAHYKTERNIYRGPFNQIWDGIFNGIIRIVPGKKVQKILRSDKKKKTPNA